MFSEVICLEASMRRRNVVLLAIGSLITIAFGGAITYYEQQAAGVQMEIVEMVRK